MAKRCTRAAGNYGRIAKEMQRQETAEGVPSNADPTDWKFHPEVVKHPMKATPKMTGDDRGRKMPMRAKSASGKKVIGKVMGKRF